MFILFGADVHSANNNFADAVINTRHMCGNNVSCSLLWKPGQDLQKTRIITMYNFQCLISKMDRMRFEGVTRIHLLSRPPSSNGELCQYFEPFASAYQEEVSESGLAWHTHSHTHTRQHTRTHFGMQTRALFASGAPPTFSDVYQIVSRLRIYMDESEGWAARSRIQPAE